MHMILFVAPCTMLLVMSTLSNSELETKVHQWMKTNRKENSRLEFKQRIEISTPDSKAEFIRDVIALANSEGENPRRNGHIVVGFRDGKHFDIAGEGYDGARFGQILDAYISPQLRVEYEEFDNGNRGRVGVLIIKPDSAMLYVVRKKLSDDKGRALIAPGQCWGRKSDRKQELDGDAIHARIAAIVAHEAQEAKMPLLTRITTLEKESGPALAVKHIRFEMESTREWTRLEIFLERLLPYVREFDDYVKHEALDAVRAATARTRDGMTVHGVAAIDNVLGEVMPIGTGGMNRRSREKISIEDLELLKRVGHIVYEITWDACRYVRNLEIVEICAQRYWYLIRYVTVNKLRSLQTAFLGDLRHCQNICKEPQKGVAFSDAWELIEKTIRDALSVPAE